MLNECFVDTPESDRADLDLQKIVEKLSNSISTIETAEGAALQAEIEQPLRRKSQKRSS